MSCLTKCIYKLNQRSTSSTRNIRGGETSAVGCVYYMYVHAYVTVEDHCNNTSEFGEKQLNTFDL